MSAETKDDVVRCDFSLRPYQLEELVMLLTVYAKEHPDVRSEIFDIVKELDGEKLYRYFFKMNKIALGVHWRDYQTRQLDALRKSNDLLAERVRQLEGASLRSPRKVAL